ncbi:unnamed protein product [Dibothriocephalus latus]|uniref:Tubulin/FtsZ GTPase domain-containing protein n=1 Tax=Dibothriocephalus latus TaxID=60516 RepID=A0A3P7PQG6_DIBLA|nr:unnamed protein product [Dibothriocephalus latus]
MGQCGTQISQALWELISVEHGIGPDGMLVDPVVQTEDDTAASNVLFTHTQKDRFVPRAAIVDSEPTVVGEWQSKCTVTPRISVCICYSMFYINIIDLYILT